MTMPVIGILLAGGQSKRMGADKAELTLGGYSQLQRTETLLHQSGCEDVLISRNSAAGIADIYVNQGPLAGVHAAISNARCPAQCVALVVPVDMPLLSTGALTELIEQARSSGLNAYFDDCYLPCVLHLNTSTVKELEQRLENGQRSVKSFLYDTGAASFTSDERQPLFNTNTPSEWQQACLAYHR